MNAAGFPKRVTICEVGPRDGLQNEAVTVRTDDKVRYIDLLVAAGFSNIEVTSFVSPKAVPQLADAEAVFTQLIQVPACRYIVLVPNERGLERALAAGARAIAVFTAATDSFTHRNIGMTIDESLAAFEVVIKRAKADGVYVRASISTAFGCPFEGAVPVANVVRVAERLLALGADELSVADTIGVATPNQVFDVVGALAPRVPLERVGLHFHDTRGMGLANIMAGLQTGVAIYDASAGGLGGCPFAPGATGNVATEDVLYLLAGMGIETGIDLAKVRAASRFIGEKLTGRVVSRAFHALEAADRRAAVHA
ncbi:MAG: hydroxymethylglutaryl-CoA lyase [Candidatus Velthaea sp.]|jgi:isopropylmalate/homocitrate/citramalate synthase